MQDPLSSHQGSSAALYLQGRREGAGTKIAGSFWAAEGARTLLRVLWILGSAPFSPPTFLSSPPHLCIQGLTISMEPSLEFCLPTAGLLCPSPAYLLPLEGQSPSDVWRPGSSWVPGEGVDRTAAPEHPPWGTAPRDAHPGEGELDHDHNLKCQRPSLFCALLSFLLLFIRQQLCKSSTIVTPFYRWVN